MSNALDKSLDDIISSGKKNQRQKKQQGKLRGSGAKTPAGQKKQQQLQKKAAEKLVFKATAPKVDLSYATKVLVLGLPNDLKPNMIKVRDT